MNSLISSCSSGIPFTAQSVLDIREGRKTQTRRLLPDEIQRYMPAHLPSCLCISRDGWHIRGVGDNGRAVGPMNPRYKPRKRYYVKETWQYGVNESTGVDGYFYRERGDQWEGGWRSSLFMPRAAARYAIEVEDVTLQRLQDITEENARAEGFEPAYISESWACMDKQGRSSDFLAEPGEERKRDLVTCVHRPRELLHDARESYSRAWDAINGKRAPWTSNPWIWAIKFRLLTEVSK